MIGGVGIIETERLLIRPFLLDDFEELYTLASHPDVWRYDPGYERTREQTLELMRYRIQQFDRLGIGRLALRSRSDGALIGYAGLQMCLVDYYSYTQAEVELFYGLGRPFWGQGYATEASRAILQDGFVRLRLRRVVASALKDNHRSIEVLRRLGMRIRDHTTHEVLGILEHPDWHY
jgi:RimJ/RimL family protein N-acetyltransferase